ATDEATVSYTSGNILSFATDSTTNGDIAFFTDDLYLDKSTGNVGVGNTAPGQRLSVAGTLGVLEGGTTPTYYTVFQGGDQSGTITYTLPTAVPASNGYVLSSTTAGVLSWAAAGSGSSTLQTDYNATSGNTILTTTGRNIAFTLGEVATPTMFIIENQDTAGSSAQYMNNSIASGTLTNGLQFEQTGAGTVTNAISILRTAGTITKGVDISGTVGTGISIGSGVTTGIAFAGTTNTIDMNNASNSTLSITNSGTGVASVSIEAGGSYAGAGAVTLSSGGSAGLTLDSASNTTTIAASDTALTATGVTTLTLGAGVSITNATGDIILQPAGSGTTANIQIGAGGSGSTTFDYLLLDVKSTSSDPGTGTEGAMYYNTSDDSFRCFKGTAWAACDQGGILNRQTFTSGTNATYTPTAGTKYAVVEMWGGGGAGGGVSATASGAGGGGGAGGYARYYLTAVSGTYTYSIGSGGTGNSGATGGAGGNTTFVDGGTTVTAYGGSGGIYVAGSTTAKPALGGAGGVVSVNGHINGAGVPGYSGQTGAATVAASGAGGSTQLGGGGAGRNTSGAGNAAVANTGSGGAGAACVTSGAAAAAGGAGSAGRIVITEYK
ncbi:MAG TPA: hypothetical protein VN420_05105, partial [Candidatus Fimivivens sp.]|nr:hypothetical protein [Candidatus Fimivivens sp.]